jgi:dihydroorotate dehydrogenase
LLSALRKEIQLLKNQDHSIPLFVKLAPDLSVNEFNDILDVLIDIKLDGVILTNTTLDKSILGKDSAMEGGLSGKPLRSKSTEMIRHAFLYTNGKLPIMGVGGIFSGEDMIEKIKAGASLIQVYTGYIYEGPIFPRLLCRYLEDYLERNHTVLAGLIGSAN